MTVTFPDAVKSMGSISAVVVQTIADITAPKLATEINATTSVNVSCYLYSGGTGTATTNKGDAPRRVCSRNTFQQFGNTSFEIADLQYVYNPQGASSDASNKAKAALTPGSFVYLVVRKGLDGTAPFAATQIAEVWRVQLGPQNRGMTGDGEFDEFAVLQTARVVSTPALDAVIAT